MEKILTLEKDVFDTITTNGNLSNGIRGLLEIPDTMNYGIGDTMVMLNTPCKERDVFKLTNKQGETRYFIVIEPVDANMAYCYSIYAKKITI